METEGAKEDTDDEEALGAEEDGCEGAEEEEELGVEEGCSVSTVCPLD